jgi:TPR repeat protein
VSVKYLLKMKILRRKKGADRPASRQAVWGRKTSTEFSTGCRVAAISTRTGAIAAVVAVSLLLSGPPAASESADPRASMDPASLVARAESGDPWAQLNLGAAYDHGVGGFPLDPVRAVAWYRVAAEAGLAEAQFNLAHCLATGNGVARADGEALTWMLRAAEQGLASAQYLAGVMYLEGVGTSPDRKLAREWLQRAADAGNLDAAVLLQRGFAAAEQY